MKPLIIGHRGALYYEAENTLGSIKKAIELGVDAVEIDVHLTKDNQVVVIHDDKVDRTTNGEGFVKDYSLKDLKKLLAENGEGIPTLQEVIDFVKNKIKIIVELKVINSEEEVVKIIEKNDLFENVYVISFWHSLVKEVKKLNNKIKTGILFVGNPINPSQLAQNANAEALVLNYKFVDKELVDEAHKNNLKVFVWNIDDDEEIKPIVDLNIDGIGSNKPDVLVNYFNNIS